MRATTPTTRLIASHCGFNQSTVSRALQNDVRISPATRRLVLKAARKLGWQPNPLAAAYSAHVRSTKTARYQASITYLITNRDSPDIDSLPYYQQAGLRGAMERAHNLGYKIDPIWLHEPGMTGARLFSILRSRGTPGVIVPGIMHHSEALASFPWRHFAASALSYSLVSPALHRVSFHVTHGVTVALENVRRLGYRRIGVVLSRDYDNLQSHGLFQSLYYEKHQPWGKNALKIFIFENHSARKNRDIRSWLLKERPEVIIGEEPVWHVLQAMGWKVPGDVAYVSLDWSPTWPDIGGIDQRHETIGTWAVDLVATQLIQNERGIPAVPKLMLVHGCWRDAPSVPDQLNRQDPQAGSATHGITTKP